MLAGTVSALCGDVLDGYHPANDEEGTARELHIWSVLEDLGIAGIGVPEEGGGSGGSLRDAATVLKVLGRWGVSTPMAEGGFLTTRTAAHAGISVGEGLSIPVIVDDRVGGAMEDGTVHFNGTLIGVPWARYADELMLVVPGKGVHQGILVRAPRPVWTVSERQNLAGEPRDDVSMSLEGSEIGVEAAEFRDWGSEEVFAWGAFARSAQICGAFSGILNLCIEYTANRHQFKKPLIAFQAIQHYVALIADEVVMANAALELATCLADSDYGMTIAAAVAKTRMSTAVGRVARLAHQVHGAIGFTREYSLQRFTRRLWCWRDEYGNEKLWSTRLGRWASQGDVWELITSVP
jgi:acyl-CoA dehydrogenase